MAESPRFCFNPMETGALLQKRIGRLRKCIYGQVSSPRFSERPCIRIVNSSANRVNGLIRGMNCVRYRSLLSPDQAGKHPRQERNSQADKYTLSNLADANMYHCSDQAKPSGENCDERPRVETVEENLKKMLLTATSPAT